MAPNPSLLHILLITKSRSGPRLVLAYPPRSPSASPSHGPSRRNSTASASLTHSSRTSSPSSLASDDFSNRVAAALEADYDDDAADSGAAGGGGGGGGASGVVDDDEHVLGCSRDGLAKLCAPGRRWEGGRWEVALHGVVLVGCPVFERAEGGWGKTRRRGRGKERHTRPKSGSEGEARQIGVEREDVVGIESPTHAKDGDADDDTDDPGAHGSGSRDTMIANAADGDAEADADTDVDALTMFNVVFALQPPRADYQVRIRELHRHIVRKLAIALRHRQREADYVADEARRITGVVEKARDNGASFFPFPARCSETYGRTRGRGKGKRRAPPQRCTQKTDFPLGRQASLSP